MIEVRGLRYTYPGGREPAVRDLTFSVQKGEASGDVNGDGVANSVDAALILQNAASMIAGGLGC